MMNSISGYKGVEVLALDHRILVKILGANMGGLTLDGVIEETDTRMRMMEDQRNANMEYISMRERTSSLTRGEILYWRELFLIAIMEERGLNSKNHSEKMEEISSARELNIRVCWRRVSNTHLLGVGR